MASVESQSRFGQSVKGLLSDKVGCCSGDVIALTRQVLKGSRSQEVNIKQTFVAIFFSGGTLQEVNDGSVFKAVQIKSASQQLSLLYLRFVLSS